MWLKEKGYCNHMTWSMSSRKWSLMTKRGWSSAKVLLVKSSSRHRFVLVHATFLSSNPYKCYHFQLLYWLYVYVMLVKNTRSFSITLYLWCYISLFCFIYFLVISQELTRESVCLAKFGTNSSSVVIEAKIRKYICVCSSYGYLIRPPIDLLEIHIIPRGTVILSLSSGPTCSTICSKL